MVCDGLSCLGSQGLGAERKRKRKRKRKSNLTRQRIILLNRIAAFHGVKF